MGQAILTTTNAAWAWSTTGGQTTITCEALGGGGAGGDATTNPGNCGGGKGGSYAKVVITKGAESTLNITVGGAAQASTVVQGAATVLSAAGGASVATDSATGASALVGSNIGDTTFAGGNGGNATGATILSGAGGGAAGPTGVGGAATAGVAGAPDGGTFLNGNAYGGVSGAGVAVRTVGVAGSVYGGAGSGGNTDQPANKIGGAGAAGIVVLTWADVLAREVTAETFKLDDIGQGVVERINPGALKLSDSVTAALAGESGLSRAVTDEALKLSDSVTAHLTVLERLVGPEAIKLSESVSAQLNLLLVSSGPENVKLFDSLTVQSDSLSVSAGPENLKLSESRSAQLNLLLVFVGPETLTLSDGPVLPSLGGNLSVTVTAENLRVSDTVTAKRYGDATPAAEHVRLDDIGQGTTHLFGVIHVVDELTAVMGSSGPAASVTDSLVITDSLTVLRDSLEAVASDALQVSDSVSAARDIEPAALTDASRLSDAVMVWLFDTGDPTVSMSDALALADTALVTLDPLRAVPLDELVVLAEEQEMVRSPGAIYKAKIVSTTAASTYTTTPTSTPGPNSTIVVYVVSCYASAPTIPTGVTGHGVSLTNIPLPANTLSTTHIISLWIGNTGASPTSAAVVVSQSGTTTGCAVLEFEVTGCDLVEGAFASISTANGTGTTGTVNATLAAHIANFDVAMSFWAHLANEATTPRSGWFEPTGADGNFNNPATGVEAQFRTDVFDPQGSATWTTSSAWRGLVVGVEAAFSTEPSEAVRITDTVIAQRYGDAPIGNESIRLDDSGQGEVTLVSPGGLKISDSIQAEFAGPQVIESENLTLSDTVVARLDPLLVAVSAEAVTLNDSTDNWAQLYEPDTVKISDLVQVFREGADIFKAVPQEALRLSEAVTVSSDPLLATVTTDTLKLADSVTAQLDLLLISLGQENLKLGDASALAMGLSASLLESLMISDSVSLLREPLAVVLPEALRLTDGPVQTDLGGDLSVAVTVDALKVSETVTVSLDLLQSAVEAENVTLSESLAAQLDTLLVSLQESAKLTDGPAILTSGLAASLTDGLKVSDSLTTLRVPLAVLLTDGLKVSDSLTTLRVPLAVLLTDGLKVSDAVSTGNDRSVTLQDSVTLSESLTRTLNPLFAPVTTDTLTLSDSVTAQLDPLLVSVGSENVTLADGPPTIAISLSASLLESLTIADSLLLLREPLEVVLSEALTLTDGPLDLGGDLAKAVTQEAVKLSDSVTVSLDPLLLAGTENLTLSDSVTSTRDLDVSVLLETVVLSDTVTLALGLSVALVEDLRLSDTVSAVRYPLQAILTEDLTLSDGPLQVAGSNDLLRLIPQEALTVTETVSVSEDPIQATTFSEFLTLTDTVTAHLTTLAVTVVDEGLRLSDVVSTALTLEAVLTESVVVADVVTTLRLPLEVILSEAARLSDVVVRSSGAALSITDSAVTTIALSDAVVTALGHTDAVVTVVTLDDVLLIVAP